MTARAHGPDNAEFEIRKAYYVVTEGALPYLWQNRSIAGVDPRAAIDLYQHAYRAYRKDNRLAAERWARSAKHLSRALAAEAKIAYLDAHATDLPHLDGASAEAFDLHEKSDTTSDLLDSLADHIPPGLKRMPPEMTRYLARARLHLEQLAPGKEPPHELRRAEHIRAAYEYGRVLELLALAYEAEIPAGAAKSA